MPTDQYENPLISRYASQEMSYLWSSDKKFQTWRQLWVALADSQRELGLNITEQQVQQLRDNIQNIDFAAAARHEKELRHDVMAHVHAYRDVCPEAGGIIHLGATSCFVTDNTDLLLLRESLLLVQKRLAAVLDALGEFATQYRDLPCLGFTHLQPAQPTTVGKRATLWAQDLWMDFIELQHRLDQLRARSVKGTTGTQASFLKLFDDDAEKVRKLETLVAQKMDFAQTYHVTGQTYPRKVDAQILDCLSGIAQSTHKMATDLRILANYKEIEEPHEKKQIGSSAMAYKRNPMRSERICALARFVISLQSSPANTLATQWMERTLDDSANRRLVLPQAFLAIDSILLLCENVCSGLVVYPKVIEQRLQSELPFMATENILMAAVALGGDRQVLHEVIREHSNAAGLAVKNEGKPNDLLRRIEADPAFSEVDLTSVLNTQRFVGTSPAQVDEFVRNCIDPIRKKFPDARSKNNDQIRV
ncbi:MAG: adenylosuccinate lyase [Planctomycetales bacterium]|nr:adenylosuccinate lyase [Planctomycetales bacterium]